LFFDRIDEDVLDARSGSQSSIKWRVMPVSAIHELIDQRLVPVVESFSLADPTQYLWVA